MIKYIVLFLFLILKCFTLHHCFFWDNAAGYSMPATYLLENGLLSFVYPAQYVAEPPLAHMYLALLWQLFGKSLWVAHLSVTVFSLGIIWQVYRLCERLKTQYTPYIFLLVLLEPALFTQMLMISPDVIMCFFALLSINMILDERRGALALSALCLGLVSIRGFVVCAGLGLVYLAISMIIGKKSLKEAFCYVFPCFIPVLLALGGWFVCRKIETGYFMYQPGFIYDEHRQLAGLGHMAKNVASMGVRMLDSGRIIVWIFLIAAMIKMGVKRFFSYVIHSPLCLIFTGILFTMSLVTIPMTNPFGDRYFLVLYILIALIASQLIVETFRIPRIRLLFIGMIAVLVSGNYWVYSERMSKAWDSVLCHLPYYSLRQDMIGYLEEEGIGLEEVGASFPVDIPFKYTDASDDNRQFAPLDMDTNRYVLYTNIYNWGDETIDALYAGWVLQKEFKRGVVFFRLYVPR